MSASQINATQSAVVDIVRAAKPAAMDMRSGLYEIRGMFNVSHWRGGKRINEWNIPNGITNEGKNKLLDVCFDAATQITTWWMGLIDNASFSALADSDTYDDINQAGNGWDEFTSYTDANNGSSTTTRPEWGPDAASAQSISNSTVAIYDITGSGTVKGVFTVGGIAGAQNKGDHASGGTLWATALFTSGDVVVAASDQLKVTYTVSA